MAERFRKLPGMDPVMDSALSFRGEHGRPGFRRPPQGLGHQAVVGAAADLDDRLAPAQGARHRGGDRAGAAHRPRLADPRRQHRDLLVRRCLQQPCHRADRVQRRGVDGVPEAAGAGAVRLRGQRHRHLGEDAGRLDRAQFLASATTSTISTPMASTWPTATDGCSAAVEHCRRTRRPTFLHLRTTRIMGHAGTDFEIEWRSDRGTGRGRGGRPAAAFGRRSRWSPA